MTKTQILDLLCPLICAIAALGAETNWIPFLPCGWRQHVAAVALAAMWIKSHRNLFIDPNGTSAADFYTQERTR